MSDEAEKKSLPYGCDYAKTSRSSCKDKECGQSSIDQGDLRMSARTKSGFFDGFQDNWFHFDCFWKRARKGITEASIRGFEHLKWDDQERIRDRIKRKDDIVDDIKPQKNAKCEYSKSSRSSCITCSEKFDKEELRISFRSSFYHPQCLADKHTYKKPAEEMDDFDKLEEADQEMLRTMFVGKAEDDIKKEQAGKEDEMTLEELKTVKEEGGLDESGMEALREIEKRKEALKTQTELIWEAHEAIENVLNSDKSLKTQKSKKAFVEDLIEKNGGNVYPKWTLADEIQYLADIAVFGGFEPCPTCSRCDFYYSADRRVYQCAGAGQDNRCSYSSREIRRRPFDGDGNKGLEKYDGKKLLPGGRIYSKSVEDHAEEDKLVILTAATPVKKIDPSRKRKKEPEGEMKNNGFSVDPYFKNADDFHVYVDEDGDPHQFLGHQISEKSGNVKFYKLQLLQEDNGESLRLFRRYGAVLSSTKDMINEYTDLDKALKEFSKIYKEKTGNPWSDRHEEHEPKSGKYNVVEWNTDLAGTYGRTTAETQASDEPEEKQPEKKKSKKAVKKPKKGKTSSEESDEG